MTHKHESDTPSHIKFFTIVCINNETLYHYDVT